MKDQNKPWLNSSGLPDPTAYEALKRIEVEEKYAKKLVTTMKCVADLAGFIVIGKIQIKHKKTGRTFKL